MVSMTRSTAENDRATSNGKHERTESPLPDGESPAIVDGPKKRKSGGALPLDVGTRVMCRWRDGKFHPVKVIERRKISSSPSNTEYEYYVHYTEFNRRLDEWAKLEQLDLDTVETDVDEKVEDKATSLKMTRHQKRKIDETHVEGSWFETWGLLNEAPWNENEGARG